MPDYGKSEVLGTATVLPATSASAYLILNHANKLIIAGFVVISSISIVIAISTLSRYLINRRKMLAQ